jgi:hypothetical protein
VAIPGWVEDRMVDGIRRARAGEPVGWLAAELRSPGSPKAHVLERRVQERVQEAHERRLRLLQWREHPPTG